MANTIYPLYKQSLLNADANVSLMASNVKVTLIDAANYTYNAAHRFFSDIPAAARVATSGNLATKSVANGVFDADNITFQLVSGASAEAFLVWIDTGVEATSRLVYFGDSGHAGLPVTPNGGNIATNWAAAGIFKL